MRLKIILITFCLIITIGQSLGRTVKNETNGEVVEEIPVHKGSEKSTTSLKSPLDQLFDSWFPNFEEEMDVSTMFDEHQKAMDSMDRVFDDNQKQQFGSMPADVKDFQKMMSDLILGDSFSSSGHQRQEELPELWESVDPKSQTLAKSVDPIDRTSKSGLPVFHPKHTSDEGNGQTSNPSEIIESNSKSGLPVFHPIHSLSKNNGQSSKPTINIESTSKSGLPVFHPNESKNESIDVKPPMDQMTLDLEWDSDDKNKSLSMAMTNDTTEAEQLIPNSSFQDFMDTVLNSFANIGNEVINTLISDINSVNTSSNDTEKEQMLITESLENGWVGVKMVECDCPEAIYGRHRENCPMNAMHMNKSDIPLQKHRSHADEHHSHRAQVDVKQTDKGHEDKGHEDEGQSEEEQTETEMTDEELEEKRISGMERLAKEGMELYRDLMPNMFNKEQEIPITIEHNIRHEIRVKKENDYKWYDWVLVGLIATTSSLLLITALFVCINRKKHSKSVDLIVGKSSDSKSDRISYKNENFNNSKGMEKMKAFFVNLK